MIDPTQHTTGIEMLEYWEDEYEAAVYSGYDCTPSAITLVSAPLPFTTQHDFEQYMQKIGYSVGMLAISGDGHTYCNPQIQKYWQNYEL